MSRQLISFGWIPTYRIAVTGHRSWEVEVTMDMTLHILRMLPFQLHVPYLFVYEVGVVIMDLLDL
jgi:hypothetical protein